MNKTLAIIAFVLVAVVMGMSTIAPVMAAEAGTGEAIGCAIAKAIVEFALRGKGIAPIEAICG